MVVEAARNLIGMLRLLEVDHRFTLAELEAITEGVINRNRHLLTAGQDYEIQTVVRTIPSARGNKLTPQL